MRRANSQCFFFNDTATTEIYTLSLHDALPISLAEWLHLDVSREAHTSPGGMSEKRWGRSCCRAEVWPKNRSDPDWRSEEHTSELQSQSNLVCRLLLEKKKEQKDSA